MTAVMVDVEADCETVAIVNCGHPSPILLHDGKVLPLDAGQHAVPLGLGDLSAEAQHVDRFDLAVGDVFTITFVNDATMGHGIDFHAGSLAPDVPMHTLDPGQSLTYQFVARYSGAWLYHCSTMPMSLHIANGMYGAVIIDPPGLPAVDTEIVLVQSELYLGAQDGTADEAKIAAETPDALVFNGYVDQYDHAPIRVKAGSRLRVWVVDAGPQRGTAFHVVGAQFDTVFAEGAYRLKAGNAEQGASQVMDLAPAQGGFVELVLPEPGHYRFTDHAVVDGERGAHGIFEAY